ncbi:hypothetical protein QLG13_06825 [Rhodococcus aetherivorans]|uniref:hypothetical protein n=2 Tax=Rhodococcus aetherivorans TaxID=191292 RepID=UPI00241BF318|nr:hypothetical protein [Rhodococcus aetherivorans]WFS13039.1 hypothetical protein P9K37_25325 [Rhodococcus aetherivorans]
MTYPLVEKSRERSEAGRHFVIEDYTKTPSLCRRGVWVGRRVDFSETVLMSFEHGQDDLSVGWIVNGAAVSPAGYYAPCQGVPTIRYRCPGDGRNLHTISLMSTSGSDQDCVDLQVVFTRPPQWNPLEYGPSKKVCLQGRIVEWPWFLLQQEQQCWERFRNVFEKYVVVPRPVPAPPGPVERWIASLRGDEAATVRAELDTVEQLDHARDGDFLAEIRADLAARFLRWANSEGGPGAVDRSPPRSDPGRDSS